MGLSMALLLAACEPTPSSATQGTTHTVQPVAAADVNREAPTARPAKKTRQPSIAANEMQWDTRGGGQVTFSIARNGQDYDVHVTSLHFEKRDERFTITPESAAVYRAITAVMQDQGSIGSNAPGGPPSGSWTTLRFSDGEQASVFEDVVGYSDLKIIYEYVIAQIRP
jgi:hypothetical protein